jgi:hypothetical protein
VYSEWKRVHILYKQVCPVHHTINQYISSRLVVVDKVLGVLFCVVGLSTIYPSRQDCINSARLEFNYVLCLFAYMILFAYMTTDINHFIINYFWCRKSWMWGPLKEHHYICSRTSLVPHPQLIFRQLARLCRKQATCHCVFFVGRLYTQKLISS